MPYQLRRTIGINITNPTTGLPSGRIAELDPRGGVLVVGENGVGKTTLLRTVPLFYGASPSQVLKGSGRTAMISYTLPDPSSAVAYEYERENSDQLRTVVMYAKEGEEVPQFHIVRSGFQEDLFYDETNHFVDRREFKARAEARGIEVTRLLSLHEYRSVILHERTNAKNAKELIALARQHSLGPRSLRNLHQIAAAMANETIKFQDLKNIVLERVSEDQASESKRPNVRELKQSKEAVARWIESRSHMADILKRRPEADRMRERITQIKGLHLDLCSLHVAVKGALAQGRRETEALLARRHEQETAAQAVLALLTSSIEQAITAKGEANHSFNAHRTIVEANAQKLAHFDEIDARDLAAKQAREPERKLQLLAQRAELDSLTAQAGTASSNYERSVQEAQRANDAQAAAIAARATKAKEEQAAKSLLLVRERDAALQKRTEPPRLAELAAERRALSVKEGEISAQMRNPAPRPETVDAHGIAVATLDQSFVDSEAATAKTREAFRVLEQARKSADDALATVDGLERSQDAALKLIDAINAEMRPEPGSLLEFIRADGEAIWTEASKLLNPELLHRTDLSPQLLADAVEDLAPAGSVIIGNTSVQLGQVEPPSWYSMDEVRARLEQAKSRAATITQRMQEESAEAKLRSELLSKAATAHGQAQALEALAVQAVKSARAERDRLAGILAAEKSAAKEVGAAELVKIKALATDVEDETSRIRKAFTDEEKAIRDDCSRAVGQLEADTATALQNITAEQSELGIRTAATLARLRKDYDLSLQGMGLDPTRIAAVQEAVNALSRELDLIAMNRHEVAAWETFSATTLPNLEAQKRELARLKDQAAEADRALSDLQESRDQRQAALKEALQTIDGEVERLKADAVTLEKLIVASLGNFLDHVPASAHAGRSLHDLEQSVTQQLAALGGEERALQGEVISLRNEFRRRAGGPSDWLDLKSRELPDRQTRLSHEFACLEAQQLCDWFEPMESGDYVDQLNSEMNGFFENANAFVTRMDQFDRLVTGFSSELGAALGRIKHFERFKDLGVKVSSSVGQQAFLKVLRRMQDRGSGVSLVGRSIMRKRQDLPTEEDAALVREYRDILQVEGGLMVNLSEQVQLECSLYENGVRRSISNDEEFRAISSNGNSALITAMFLLGFVQMIRGTAPVRLVWVTDELGRFSASNVGAFLSTLSANDIDVISASPSVDPALARHFPRLSMFENTGAIFTSENTQRERHHEQA